MNAKTKAKSRQTKYNNKLALSFPLFAGKVEGFEYKTFGEAMQDQLQAESDKDKRLQDLADRMKKLDEKFAQDIIVYKIILSDIIGSYHVNMLQDYLNKRTWATGIEYMVDFWNTTLASVLKLKSYQVCKLLEDNINY